MRYLLDSDDGALEIDSDSGPLSGGVVAGMARMVEALGSLAVTPTGPFVPVRWDTPAALAEATGRLLGVPVTAIVDGVPAVLPPVPSAPGVVY